MAGVARGVPQRKVQRLRMSDHGTWALPPCLSPSPIKNGSKESFEIKFHKNKEEKMTVDKFRQQIFRRLTRDRFLETDVALWRKLKPNCLGGWEKKAGSRKRISENLRNYM